MHRFYVEMVGDRPRFKRAQLHQIHNVLRLRDGEHMAIFDGSGAEWIVQLAGDTGVIVQAVDQTREPETRLILYQALIKPARFEYVLQKGTELGIARFVPFIAERSVASGERRERWRAIVIEAAEQSGRTIVPDV